MRNKGNVYYGLHALNNLDIAVNGRSVNSMPSYHQQIRQLDSTSGGSVDYSPPPPKRNNNKPTKPPRKTSMSPPPAPAPPPPPPPFHHHYDRPEQPRSVVMDQLHQDPRFKRRLFDSGGEGDFFMSEETTSSSNNHPLKYRYDSPVRTCLTDTEILRSPTEVLYAVSDKQQQHRPSVSSQTHRSELLNSNNGFKTRIHVTSPDYNHPQNNNNNNHNNVNRKPYKTTINTATDNIQYRREPRKPFYEGTAEHYKVPRRFNGDQFTSTRLVKNVETRRSSELDREGRSIRRSSDGRTYSGCSTSPDREDGVGGDRYSKPRVPARLYHQHPHHHHHEQQLHHYQQQQQQQQRRSPSSSPSRPPRSKSSPGREYHYQQNRRTSVPRNNNNNNNNFKDGIRRVKKSENETVDDDRLSRFTEYRGDDHVRNSVVNNNNNVRSHSDLEITRERGRSLPPGAHIDSIRDFYKSSQFKSMYALPPSPNRPAPVLDRIGSSSTLRHPRHSQSGEINEYNKRYKDNSSPKRRAPSPPRSSGTRIQIRRPEMNDNNPRRVLSADRVLHPPSNRRTTYSRRRQSVDGATTLDSSYSESDGMTGEPDQRSPPTPWSSSLSTDDFNEEQEEDYLEEEDLPGCFSEKLSSKAVSVAQMSAVSTPIIRNSNTAIIKLHHPHKEHLAFAKQKRGHVMFHDDKRSFSVIQEKPLGEFGRRWMSGSGHSDLDSDYRRDLATNGSTTNLHQEARGRDGGFILPRSSTLGRNTPQSTKSLDRRYHHHHGHGHSHNHQHHHQQRSSRRRTENDDVDDDDLLPTDDEDDTIQSPSREEERRKVLEIEEERLRLYQRGHSHHRPHNGGNTAGGVGIGNGSVNGASTKKQRNLMSEVDSQYSGRSSSTVVRKHPNMRINKRNGGTGVGGVVRREVVRKKMPGSVTSSVNSSESEPGSNRSVFLHTTAVADIPTPAGASIAPKRTMSESRENLTTPSPSPPNTNLQKSQKISRSISLLAPWKPKNYKDKFEIHYNNGPANNGKPPRPPSATRSQHPKSATLKEKRSASSSDLLRNEQHQHRQPPPPRTRPVQRTQSTKVSRSVSMPKDTRLAGWFKKKKKT